MRNFWTSDTHIEHKNICGPSISSWSDGYREFTSLEEMRGTILEGINSTIGESDRMFFLGDSVFGMNKLETFKKFFGDIRCKNIVYCAGNHDDFFFKHGNLAEVEKIVGKVHVLPYYETIDGFQLWNCHYSPEEFDVYKGKTPHKKENRILNENFKRQPNLIYLYAHYHSKRIDKGFGLDIGMDCTWNGHKKYTPFSFDEIIAIMKERGFNEKEQRVG